MTPPSVSEEMIRALETRITRRETISLDEYGARKAVRLMEQDAELFRSVLAHLPAGSEAVEPLEGLPLSPTGHHEESDPYPRFAAPPSTPPAANVQDGWSAHPDQTSPMTVGPEAFLEEPDEVTEALELAVEWLEIDPVAEERGVVARIKDALVTLRSKQAPTVAVPDEAGVVDQIACEIMALPELRRIPDDEDDTAGTRHGQVQEIVSRILRARAEQREAPNVAVGEGVAWPAYCIHPGSCSRHRECMYTGCKHEGSSISEGIEAALAAAPTSDGR